MVNSLTSLADNHRSPRDTKLYGPLVLGEAQPLKLPPLSSDIDPHLIIKCLRFLVTEGRLPAEADFFQPNQLTNIVSNSAKFCTVAALATGAVSIAGKLLAEFDLVANSFGLFAAVCVGLVVSTLRTRTISRRNSERRRALRNSWGFSTKNKDVDLSVFRAAATEADHLLHGLSKRIAERHRWTFDPADPCNLERAAGYVTTALLSDDDSLTIDPTQPIDRGNIQRYRDSALQILDITEHGLSGYTTIGT